MKRNLNHLKTRKMAKFEHNTFWNGKAVGPKIQEILQNVCMVTGKRTRLHSIKASKHQTEYVAGWA